ncbi:MAG TPA: HesA/MoeB/ThiF family protein, partial [Phycisphaerae bacterium]|nr:HesA/MoeB/ThiF family protein [Phycisphaerae bacterium]
MLPKKLTDDDRARYEWQMWHKDFGEAGQEKLKNATVLISRVGGVGSVVAYELAAAGVGKILLGHGGNIKTSDLNRQLVMTTEALGTSRAQSAKRRLAELNPTIELAAIESNITDDNVADIVAQVDVVV